MDIPTKLRKLADEIEDDGDEYPYKVSGDRDSSRGYVLDVASVADPDDIVRVSCDWGYIDVGRSKATFRDAIEAGYVPTCVLTNPPGDATQRVWFEPIEEVMEE